MNLDVPELCGRFWSLGHRGSETRAIAADARGQVLVADQDENTWVVKVYSHSGKLQYSLHPDLAPPSKTNSVLAIATDRDDNLYVLARIWHKRTESGSTVFLESFQREFFIYVFHQNDAPPSHTTILPTFPLQTKTADFKGRKMTVYDNKHVFVAGELYNLQIHECHVEVFDTEGELLHSFGEKILQHPHDITTANDGRVLVLDDAAAPCVHTFSAGGDHLEKFPLVECSSCEIGSLAFDRCSAMIFVSLWGGQDGPEDVKVSVYKDGKFQRHVSVLENDNGSTRGVAVSGDGLLAVICNDRSPHRRFGGWEVRVGEVKKL